LSLSLPKVSNAGSDSTKKTPENKEKNYLAVSIPVLCNNFNFYPTLLHYVLLGTVLCFSLHQLRENMKVHAEGEDHSSMKNEIKRCVFALRKAQQLKDTHVHMERTTLRRLVVY